MTSHADTADSGDAVVMCHRSCGRPARWISEDDPTDGTCDECHNWLNSLEARAAANAEFTRDISGVDPDDD